METETNSNVNTVPVVEETPVQAIMLERAINVLGGIKPEDQDDDSLYIYSEGFTLLDKYLSGNGPKYLDYESALWLGAALTHAGMAVQAYEYGPGKYRLELGFDY